MQRMNDDMSEYEDQYTLNEYTNKQACIAVFNTEFVLTSLCVIRQHERKSQIAVASSLRNDDVDQQ
jgi:hypothetical protein